MDRAPFVPHLEYDLDIEAYHAREPISKSGLDLIALSPAIYYGRALDPNRPPRAVKPGQLEGNLAHCAILEPAEFEKRYRVVPANAPRRPTEAQWNAANPSESSVKAMAWWTQWNEQTNGATVVTNDQYTTAMRQAESVRKIADVRDALDRGRAEVSAFWTDEMTGVQCRARPDWVHDCGSAGDILLDVKTYGDASAREFRRQIARKRYHVQDAFYSDGYAEAAQRAVLGFVFVAVESEWPYAANAVMLDDESKAAGRFQYSADLSKYQQCLSTGAWPGYSSGIDIVSLPNWALNQIEE